MIFNDERNSCLVFKKIMKKSKKVTDMKVGDIRIFTFSFKNESVLPVILRCICLDKRTNEYGTFVYLSGYSGSTIISNWYPLECAEVSIPKYRDNQIRQLFISQLDYYNSLRNTLYGCNELVKLNRLNKDLDKELNRLNTEIVHKLGYITKEEFEKLITEKIPYSECHLSVDGNGCNIIECISMDKEDIDIASNKLSQNEVSDKSLIDKYKGKEKIHFIKNEVKSDKRYFNYVYSNDSYVYYHEMIFIFEKKLDEGITINDVDIMIKKMKYY